MRKPDYLGIISALIVFEQSFLKLQIGADIHKKGTTRLKYLKHRSIVTTLSLPPEKPTRTSSVIFDMTFMRSYSATDILASFASQRLSSLHVISSSFSFLIATGFRCFPFCFNERPCGFIRTAMIEVVVVIYARALIDTLLEISQSSCLISSGEICTIFLVALLAIKIHFLV